MLAFMPASHAPIPEPEPSFVDELVEERGLPPGVHHYRALTNIKVRENAVEHSADRGVVREGEDLLVMETRTMEDGTVRARIDRGWVNLELPDGKLLMELVLHTERTEHKHSKIMRRASKRGATASCVRHRSHTMRPGENNFRQQIDTTVDKSISSSTAPDGLTVSDLIQRKKAQWAVANALVFSARFALKARTEIARQLKKETEHKQQAAEKEAKQKAVRCKKSFVLVSGKQRAEFWGSCGGTRASLAVRRIWRGKFGRDQAHSARYARWRWKRSGAFDAVWPLAWRKRTQLRFL